jgi:translation initiation factor 2 subunit 3
MHIARSFDVNRPGTRPAKLTGGVIGGSIIEGAFREGDEIIIGPGRKIEQGNKTRWEPIETTITSMQGGGGKRDVMMAGGLCGLGTLLDPSITTADNLSGQVLAKKGELPTIRTECSITVELMDTMVSGDGEGADKIYPLRNNEMLMVNVATSTSVGVVKGAEKGKATLHLRLPICADEGQRVSLSRRVGARWRLIGHGTIQ